MSNNFFYGDFQIMAFQQKMISNERLFKCCTIWLCSDYYYYYYCYYFAYLPVDVIILCMWRVSYFPCILKALYFIKNCSVHKEKPTAYNLGMVRKKSCCDCKVWCIGIKTTGFSRKCGRRVFKIVPPIADFEKINGITLVARLLQ